MEANSIISSQEDVLKAFSNYYSMIFSTKDDGAIVEVVRCKIRELIPKKVEEDDKVRLGKPICKEEITNAIM